MPSPSPKSPARRRELMMDTLNEASVTWISRSEESFAENMAAGINPIAALTDIHRLSVWLNSEHPDGLHASMVYRWDLASGGTTPPTAVFTDVTYADFSPNWEKQFRQKKTINGPISEMPDSEAAILKANAVCSVFIVPVYIKNNFSGFVLFEDRKTERHFDPDSADILRYAAFLLVNAVLRGQIEEKMAEADSRAKLMLDTSPMCCQLWDKNFTNIDCNEAAVRLYGFKNKQEYMDRFFETMPEFQPDGRPTAEMAKEVLTTAFEEGVCRFDCMHQHPADGSPIPAEISLFRVNYKGEHAVIGYTRDMRKHVKVMKDISYRDHLMRAVNSVAELLLNSSAESFAGNMIAGMGILAQAIDVGCVCMWRSHVIDGQRFCSLEHEWFGDNPTRIGEHSKNIPFTELPSWENMLEDRKCINALMCDIIAEQGKIAQEFLKSIRSILVVPIIINDAFWGFMGFDDFVNDRIFSETEESLMTSAGMLFTYAVIRHETFMALSDTSARLEDALEVANEANRVKSAFLANMSHEIRTPMNSIMGFAELAQDDSLPERTQNYLTKISENADWMLHIINDILDISKIESGKIVLENIPFDVHDIYEHCKSMIMPKVEEKGLTLYCYAEPYIGKQLLGDPVRLRQVITNLLSNAVKFTNSGTVKLLASVVCTNDNIATVRFEVKDSGIGMSPEQIDTIFEPFIQADSNTTRKYSGTGLGLTITKNLVELMGGHLSVVSALGVGSRFSFEVPFGLIDSPAAYEALKAAEVIVEVSQPAEKPQFDAEILICEDNDMNQQVVCEHLHRIGVKTVVAMHGQEGVDIISSRIRNNERPFDLIFMDIHMPVMDGLEAAAKITEMNISTPIVALTANVMLNNLEMYKKSGMAGYLGKPFKSHELHKCLAEHLNKAPKKSAADDSPDDTDDNMMAILRQAFVTGNLGVATGIKQALAANDYKLAYRLVHTLKSNAGHINETKLIAAALAAEALLDGAKTPPPPKVMDGLYAELKAVLEKLSL